MKKIYFIVILISSLSAYSQVLTFEDPAFKAKLLSAYAFNPIAKNSSGSWIDVDINNDNEIQVSEAENVYSLYLIEPYNIVSIQGVQGFNNLANLSTEMQPINNVDLSDMVNLETINVSGATGLLNASNCTSLTEVELGDELSGINFSNCTSLTELTFGASISEYNLDGCINLQNIEGHLNYIITTLDLTSFANLTSVSWLNGSLTTFNASGCTNLVSVNIYDNPLTHINLSGCTLLTDFIPYGPLESIDVSGCSSLPYLFCAYAETLTHLEVQDCTSMVQIDVTGNLLTSVNFSNLPNLETLGIEHNQLSSLDVSGLTNLIQIDARDNNLTELDLSNLPNLKYVDVAQSDLTVLYAENCPMLEILECEDNAMTLLNLYNTPNLNKLNCSVNNLTTISLPHSSNLQWVDVTNCLELESIFIKNGGVEFLELRTINCPELVYVCADEADIATIIASLQTFGNEGVTVDSTCSFEPTEDYNSISGIIRFDSNSNGCDDADTVFGDMKFSIQRDGEEAFIFSNNEGNYIAYAEEGIETVILTPEIDSDLFTITPASVTQEFIETGNAITADFCIVPNGTHPDLDVVLLPIFDARPGFEATYQLIINNKGNQIQSGSVALAYNDAVIDFMSASLTPTTTNTGNLTWDFNELAPFNSIIINLTFEVNTPQEDPSVNVGDILPFTATITTTETDDTPTDNVYQFNQIVIGAIDPNDKQIAEGASITPEQVGEYLHYLIRFQNTGTAEAINIRVEDILANNLDWDTFTPVSASHEYRVTLTDGNKAEFFFENIMLPAEEDNEPASHGFVAFKIKPLPGAQLGDIFENTAEIYFDFESAIITNTVTTTVEEVMGTDDFNFNSNFTVYPNPSKDIVNIKAKGGLGINSVNVYNMLGQLVSSLEITASSNTNLDISHLQDGQYLLEITTDKGKSACRLIKQ